MIGSDTPPSERLIHFIFRLSFCEGKFRHPTIGTPDTLATRVRTTGREVPTPHHRNA